MSTAGDNSNIKMTVDDETVTIKISGGFDYYIRSMFLDACRNQSMSKKFVIDLSQALYLDSSALGMLLVLLEKLGNDKNKLHVVGCNPKISKVLDVAKFGNMMTIT